METMDKLFPYIAILVIMIMWFCFMIKNYSPKSIIKKYTWVKASVCHNCGNTNLELSENGITTHCNNCGISWTAPELMIEIKE